MDGPQGRSGRVRKISPPTGIRSQTAWSVASRYTDRATTARASLYGTSERIVFIQGIVRVIKSRRMRWAGHVARMGEQGEVYRVLVGKPERKRPLGRPRRRWVDNIKVDLHEVGMWTGLGWPSIETGGGRL